MNNKFHLSEQNGPKKCQNTTSKYLYYNNFHIGIHDMCIDVFLVSNAHVDSKLITYYHWV